MCDYCNKRVLDQKQVSSYHKQSRYPSSMKRALLYLKLKDHFTSECTEYQLVMCPMYSRLRCTFKVTLIIIMSKK